MVGQYLDLRIHHLWSLRKGYKDSYINNQKWLRIIKSWKNGEKVRSYSDQDAFSIPAKFRYIASNPDETVILTKQIDSICRLCSNFNGKNCTLFTKEELLFEDERTLKDIFLFMQGEKYVSVNTILTYPIDITFPDYAKIQTPHYQPIAFACIKSLTTI